jgi:hypothetical protein
VPRSSPITCFVCAVVVSVVDMRVSFEQPSAEPWQVVGELSTP